MTSHLGVPLALGVGLFAPLLVWAANRPRPVTAQAQAVMCTDICLNVLVEYLVARFVAMLGPR